MFHGIDLEKGAVGEKQYDPEAHVRAVKDSRERKSIFLPLGKRIEETIPQNGKPRRGKGREKEYNEQKEQDPLVAFHDFEWIGVMGLLNCGVYECQHFTRIPAPGPGYKNLRG